MNIAIPSIAKLLLAQRGHLFGWSPVFFGLGVGIYFALRVEPGLVVYGAAVLGIAASLLAARLLGYALAPLGFALAITLAGFCAAGLRAHVVAGPVLDYRYYGPVQGRIVKIDRSGSDAVRLTLDQVALARRSVAGTPRRVRVSLHGDQGFIEPEPGMMVILTGHLSPPSGPVEPGGFDFRRSAWFDGLGAVGYTRTPVLMFMPPVGGRTLWLYRVRMQLSAAVQAALPGETGAFAAAIMTGDRSGMGAGTLADLRATNLAHLLAISGLHMGLLTGTVFVFLRGLFALIRPVALRLPTKKIAAGVALATGAAYLMISGGNVATERAFIMVAVMLVAVMLDRRALTLRAVAIAALIVLVLQPEEMLGPGFQMSFAATTALVAVFAAMRGRTDWLPGWARPVMATVMSSLVAGLATAPFAAAHFNQISHYGLIANLLSVPLMGLLVMPAAAATACLAVIGLGGLGLWVMNFGLRWILGVAHEIAGWNGALSHVPSPDIAVLPVLTLGMLVLILWHGRLRLLGLPLAGVAFVFWAQVERPALLVADTGGLLGLMTDAGRVLSKPQGDSFAAEVWLENDGAPVPQDIAAGRPGLDRDGRQVRAALPGGVVLLVTGKTTLAEIAGCGGADILISNQRDAGARPCAVYDLGRLDALGALAISSGADGLKVVTARDRTGTRLWNSAGD